MTFPPPPPPKVSLAVRNAASCPERLVAHSTILVTGRAKGEGVSYLRQEAQDEVAVALGLDDGTGAEVNVVQAQLRERGEAAQSSQVPQPRYGITRQPQVLGGGVHQAVEPGARIRAAGRGE